MSKKTYFEKLQDPQWQKKRLKLLESVQWKCEECDDDKNQLQVHHCYYEKGVEPWDYPDQTLLVLCKSCHEQRHELERTIKRQIGRMLKYTPLKRRGREPLKETANQFYNFDPQSCDLAKSLSHVGVLEVKNQCARVVLQRLNLTPQDLTRIETEEDALEIIKNALARPHFFDDEDEPEGGEGHA